MRIAQGLLLIPSISALNEVSTDLDKLNFSTEERITSVSFLGRLRSVAVGSILSLN